VHETRIQTRWTDFDALGHITHTAYPVYLDEARDAYLTAAVGPFADWPNVLVHVAIDYRREVRHPAPVLIVRTRIAAVGHTSVTFEQEVLADDVVVVTARSVLVAWDVGSPTARPIDHEVRAKLG
jgi:acyl-CoA thioester hydrolase